ncbi:hypothetical protein D3C71_1964610 [compost metagenome]
MPGALAGEGKLHGIQYADGAQDRCQDFIQLQSLLQQAGNGRQCRKLIFNFADFLVGQAGQKLDDEAPCGLHLIVPLAEQHTQRHS